jgi:hypothetical protein
MQADRDGALPASPMKGEVKKGSGRCTIKPKNSVRHLPLHGGGWEGAACQPTS